MVPAYSKTKLLSETTNWFDIGWEKKKGLKIIFYNYIISKNQAAAKTTDK